MPTYEYLCRKCGHTLEEFQSMSEKRSSAARSAAPTAWRASWEPGRLHTEGSGSTHRLPQAAVRPGDSGKKEAEKQETAQQTEEKGGRRRKRKRKNRKRRKRKRKNRREKETRRKRGEKERGEGTPGSQPPPPGPSGPPEKND